MRDLTTCPFPVLLSDRPSADGSFQDTRVVLHLVGDPSDPDHGLDRWRDDRVGLHQDDDGPTHLVIGRQAGADALQRAAYRLAIDVQALVSFQKEARNG